MPEANKYDILFLVDGGIGNVLEALYAVEYCIDRGKKTGVYIHTLSKSFVNFLRKSYGPEVILSSIDGVSTVNLVHSFTYYDRFELSYDNYFYIHPDQVSSEHASETEQYLSVARALFPSDHKTGNSLRYLAENHSERVKQATPEDRVVLYPGCSAAFSSKKWPYFMDLIGRMGKNQTMVIGGKEDLDFQFSYYYPKWIASWVPQKILNTRVFFNFLKGSRLLKKHAHFTGIDRLENAYFNVFEWEELVAIFRRCRFFIGNDGGLMHLAACCGARGTALFGPTSIEKNKPVSTLMEVAFHKMECQPCAFKTKGINYTYGMIACPHQLGCLYSLTVDDVMKNIPETHLPKQP